MAMAQAERYCSSCGAANAVGAVVCCRCAASLRTTIPLLIEDEVAAAPLLAHLRPGGLLKERYRILEQVGTGGFGAVYKAVDTARNNALVAVKEIGLASLSPQQVIEATDAFNREVTLLRSLKHHNIPHIYATLTDAEHWYVVMDFIDGETLEQFRLKAAGGHLPIERVLEIGIELCEVLDYLHNHQPPIIFRDVKPSNIMLTPAGHLFLIDFGVARYFQPGKRRDTIAFGSPGFAAPEQYGKAQTTAQSDIYSLGVTLYQLLTSVDPSLTPFRFLSLHVLDASIPAELESLIMRMLEMEASKRPTSMAIVRQELQRIDAKERDERDDVAASAPAARVTFSTQGLTRFIYRGHSSFVNALAWSPDGTQIASGSLDQTVQVWHALSGQDRFIYRNHSDAVSSVAWSPGGTYIASGSLDRTVQVWDAVSKPLWLRAIALRSGLMRVDCLGHTGGVQSLAWSPDGQYIAAGGDDHTVLIWEALPLAQANKYHGHTAKVLALAWSPNGRDIASTSTDRSVRIWDVKTKKARFILRDPAHIIHALCWSPGGKYLALASGDHTVQVLDASSHQKVFTHTGHTKRILAVAWSPDGKYLASASDDQTVQVWKVHWNPGANHEAPFIYSFHTKSVRAVAWSPDGQLIASGGEDGEVHVWQAI